MATASGMNMKPAIYTNQGDMHRSGRVGWLCAAVLGADDAIVSTASLMIGVAASSAPMGAILVAGFLNVWTIRLRSLLLAEADALNATWY